MVKPFFSCAILVKGERPFIREALVSLEEEEMGSRVGRVETCRGRRGE